eukprot:scaffold1126_cov74-Skeletonema_menzelii.AAC.1
MPPIAVDCFQGGVLQRKVQVGCTSTEHFLKRERFRASVELEEISSASECQWLRSPRIELPPRLYVE